MEKRMLEMDDVKEGIFFTVFRGRIEEVVFQGPDGFKVVKEEDFSLNGSVLEVIAVDLPYIVYKQYNSIDDNGGLPCDLDLRCVKIMKLSERYIRVRCPNVKDGIFSKREPVGDIMKKII